MNEFRLSADIDNPDGICEELRAKRAGVHPDRTGGSFSSRADENLYIRLTEAIESVEKKRESASAIVPATEFNKLAKVIEGMLVPIRQTELASQESQFLDAYKNHIASSYAISKISSSVLAAVFLGIISFTERLKDNSVLGPMTHLRFFPGAIWTLLVASGSLCILSWYRERNQKNRAEELSSDGGLQRAFCAFCEDNLRYELRRDDNSSLCFGKLQYAYFLMGKQRGISELVGHLREIFRRRKPKDADATVETYQIPRSYYVQKALEAINRTLRSETALSGPLGERLARIHTEKLLARKVIRKAERSDIDEWYEIDRVMIERFSRT